MARNKLDAAASTSEIGFVSGPIRSFAAVKTSHEMCYGNRRQRKRGNRRRLHFCYSFASTKNISEKRRRAA
jgi:hypothetical protein